MNYINLCPKEPSLIQYRNGTQTNKDIVEYQKKYRDSKKKKKPFVFEVKHTKPTDPSQCVETSLKGEKVCRTSQSIDLQLDDGGQVQQNCKASS